MFDPKIYNQRKKKENFGKLLLHEKILQNIITHILSERCMICNDYFSSFKHQKLREHIHSQCEKSVQFSANYCH